MLAYAFISGFGAGLLATPHCAVMCGPLSMHACSRRTWGAAWRFHAARVASYSLLGIAAGTSGAGIARLLDHQWSAAALSWMVALVLLVTAARIWRGPRAAAPIALGARTRRPLAARIVARLGNRPEILGAITALLPCGVLLAAVAMASATATWSTGAALMLGFAITSGGSLIVAGVAARWLRRAGGAAPRVLAGVLVAGALVFALRPLPGLLEPAEVDHPAGCPLHGSAGQSWSLAT